MAAIAGADLVFVDPDYGLPGTTANPVSNNGQKYVFPEDRAGYVARGQGLIVYHHQTHERHGLAKQIEEKLSVLRALSGSDPWALIFLRQSVRVYFVVPAAGHAAVFMERSQTFVQGCGTGGTLRSRRATCGNWLILPERRHREKRRVRGPA